MFKIKINIVTSEVQKDKKISTDGKSRLENGVTRRIDETSEDDHVKSTPAPTVLSL